VLPGLQALIQSFTHRNPTEKVAPSLFPSDKIGWNHQVAPIFGIKLSIDLFIPVTSHKSLTSVVSDKQDAYFAVFYEGQEVTNLILQHQDPPGRKVSPKL